MVCTPDCTSRFADPATTSSQVDETRHYIDLAADIGAPRLRIFGGKLPDGISRGAAIDGVSEAMLALADHAASRNVAVCLETHDDWCDPNHVAEVMRNVNHDAIRVNWDVLHPLRVCGIGVQEAYDLLSPWIAHVHVHDCTFDPDEVGAFTYVEMGTGLVDHRQVIDVLQSNDFDGYVSGEWIAWEPYEVHLPREIAILKSYE